MTSAHRSGRVATRLWAATERLDRIRGDTRASSWAAAKLRALIRAGRADDPRALAELTDAIEGRIRDEVAGAA